MPAILNFVSETIRTLWVAKTIFVAPNSLIFIRNAFDRFDEKFIPGHEVGRPSPSERARWFDLNEN